MSAAVDDRGLPVSRSDRAVRQALFVGWWSVVALLPIGHVTGLRNTWTVLVVLATLAWVRRDAWRDLPARTALLLLLLWCACSIGWSTSPAISFGKWRSDLLIPLLAYAAAFGYARRTGSPAALLGGVVTGMGLLALLSLTAFLPASVVPSLPAFLRLEAFPNVAGPMPVWYPGVGDASMSATLAAAVLVCAPRLLPRVDRRAWWAGWVFVVVVVLVSNNRNAALAIPAVAVASWFLVRSRSGEPAATSRTTNRTRLAVAAVGAVVLVAALLAMLETSARERLRIIGEPARDDESALVVLTERDTRPMIWAYYTRLAVKSPVIGVGFGRTVPGIHYRTQEDRALARVEFNAYIHAHNLFLNWWLQTGVIGVALLVAALVGVVRQARRAALAAVDRRAVAACVAIYALMVSMLIRDATDDFLVYGMATLFWALLGGIGGLLRSVGSRPFEAGVNAPRAP